MSKFKQRLAALGHSTYGKYLESAHWQQFQQRYKDSGMSMRCAVCSQKLIQLHHHTYKRLGREKLTDVTPLCRRHHLKVHDFLRSRRLLVESTTEAVRHLKKISGSKKRVRELAVGDDDPVLQLLRIMRSLADENGQFFLSQRVIAELLQTTTRHVLKIVQTMIDNRMIERIHRGIPDRTTRFAAVYQLC